MLSLAIELYKPRQIRKESHAVIWYTHLLLWRFSRGKIYSSYIEIFTDRVGADQLLPYLKTCPRYMLEENGRKWRKSQSLFHFVAINVSGLKSECFSSAH